MKGKKAMMKAMNNKNSKNTKRGFTLLELLVVISIIGILVAMGAVAYTTAQVSGRNARRQSDMKAFQSAQEQYYAANSSAYASDMSSLTSGNFLSNALTDPKNVVPYTYSFTYSPAYCACARLEGSSPSGNSGANCTAGTTHFCVKNLQ